MVSNRLPSKVARASDTRDGGWVGHSKTIFVLFISISNVVVFVLEIDSCDSDQQMFLVVSDSYYTDKIHTQPLLSRNIIFSGNISDFCL